MTPLRVLFSRLIDIVLRRPRDARLDDELQAHLDLLADDYMARGMEPAEARRAARRTFGNVDRVRTVYREQRGLPALDSLAQDVRFALRQIGRNPGFVATAVLILGLGIGVNNMFFTIVYAHTMRGLPIDRADRVLSIGAIDDRTPRRGFSYPDFVDVRRRATTFAGVAAFTQAPVIVVDDDRAPERVHGAFVSGEAFDVIGIRPVLGRTFTVADDRHGAAAVVVLGSRLWRARYGADPDIAGQSIAVNGTRATVVGVVPERSGFPSQAAIWLPLAQHPDGRVETRAERHLTVFGRLHDSAAVPDARAEIGAIVESLAREHPEAHPNLRAHVVPINEQYLGSLAHPAWRAFMAAGLLIVLISCANVANLLLARSAGRTREIAIRTSLGASRGRVVRQLLVEGAVLAASGGLVGLGVAMASVQVFSSAIPEQALPYWFDYTFDAQVIAALAVVSAGTVCVFALLPACRGRVRQAGPARLRECSPPGARAARPPARAPRRARPCSSAVPGSRYFATLGVPLVSGRELGAADGTPGHDHAIVNEPFVDMFLGGGTALGQRIGVREPGGPGEARWLTIVGVAPAIRQRPDQPPRAVVYVPYRAAPEPDAALVVRSGLETGALVALLRAEVQAIDPYLPLYQVRTMAQVIRDADWNARLSNRLFLYLTGIAVALATAGLFTVTAYHVSGRTREIGLRMALGAQAPHVVRMILRRAALQVALGFAAGVVFARLWEWTFPAGLPDVRTTDPQSLAIVAAILTGMTLVACIIPARRAARLDPLAALRHE